MDGAVTRRELRNTLNNVEKERQMFNALCVNYSAAYCCDLLADRMEPIKQKGFSHCARERENMQDQFCYSEWIRRAYDSFVIHESAPDYVEFFDARNLMRRLQTEQSLTYRHRTLPNGAGMEYFEATVVRLYTDEDSFRVIIGYRSIDDIVAEEQKHQRELENEMVTLKNIHETLGSGGWKLRYNAQGEMTECYWSDTMRHMLGFSSTEDFPNTFETWIDRLHPEDKERTLRQYREAVEDRTNEKIYDVEYRLRLKDGRYQWFRAAGRLSRREDGSAIVFDGVFINTEEKHRTNEQLHRVFAENEEARRRLLQEHEVISAIGRGYFSINSIDLGDDIYEEIAKQDDSIYHFTGRGGKAQEKLYALCDTLVAEEYRAAVREFFDLSTVPDRMRGTDAIEAEYLAVDGNWHLARFLEKKRTPEGRVTDILYVTRIVNRQKQQELELERQRLAYQLSESANEAKTTFLLNMSHDIRTPMNAILGYAQLMKKKLSDPELLHYQQMIEQSGNLLLSIINNVLDMARIESGKMELDKDYHIVGDVGAGVCAVFAMEARQKGLTIEHTVNIKHRHIVCDKTKMQEILTNIVSNAVKYTPPGGKITVSTRELPCEKEGWINIETTVADTGIGISADFLPHLFDSFSRERNTTAAKVSGSGLGMAIVKSLVDLMGGTVTVESELGKGSRFTVTIPHELAKATYEEDASSGGEKAADFHGKHILLAEDNDLNAEIAIAILEEMGFTVDRAEDGIICVAKLEKSAPGTYDLVFMDVQMPNMDGYKATRVIRALPDRTKAAIPIIAMTANAFAEDRNRAFQMGMNGHIAKPISVPKIVEAILSAQNNHEGADA